MGFFKRKEKKLPDFNVLHNSNIKSKYFYRICQWDWLDKNNIHVVSKSSPKLITLDPWPQQIFLDANGQISIESYVYDIASKYGKRETVPDELDEMILETIDILIKEEMIELSEDKIDIPKNIELPLKDLS